MTPVVSKAIKETNWTVISVVGGAAITAITFFASIKSDIRDLTTQLEAYHINQIETDRKLDKLYDYFFDNTLNKGKP